MKTETNKFGTGELFEAEDLKGLTYVLGAACTSIQAEMLSFANAYPSRFTLAPQLANNIVVLSCQVTDLAIYNDIQKMGKLMNDYPDADNYLFGGCLARRFDIELPHDLHNVTKRLDAIRVDYQQINRQDLIDFADPFWIPDFIEYMDDSDLAPGQLFRHMYPLRIGVGCQGKCKYCSINTTRGAHYELEASTLINEFCRHENVVLISDSPSIKQVKEWCEIAITYKKPFSIRNVEPQVAMACWNELLLASQHGFLNILHVPVQAVSTLTLADMGRNVAATKEYLRMAESFKKYGTKLATNVIIDYKDFPDPDNEDLAVFDYISWNPYWDGVWDRQKAYERFIYYLGSGHKLYENEG